MIKQAVEVVERAKSSLKGKRIVGGSDESGRLKQDAKSLLQRYAQVIRDRPRVQKHGMVECMADAIAGRDNGWAYGVRTINHATQVMNEGCHDA